MLISHIPDIMAGLKPLSTSSTGFINSREFSRFYDHSEYKETNPFLGYAVVDKGDQETRTDIINR